MTTTGTRIAILAGVLLLAACGDDESINPEADIERWLGEMEARVEDKDRRGLLDNVAEAYVDKRGQSRDDVDAMLRFWFLRADNITLLTSIEDIRVIGGTAAEVDMTVGMAGTEDVGLGIRADAYNFQLELEHDGDDWKLLSARWGDLGSPLQ